MAEARLIRWRQGAAARVGLSLFVALMGVAMFAAGPVGAAQAEAQGTTAERAKAKKKKKKKQLALEKMFNTRYCEIFGVNPAPAGGFAVKIFNSVGLGKCPEAQWAALDLEAIAAQEGWLLAAPNGPRHWLMDTIIGNKPTNPKTFGGIKMRQVATLESATLSPNPFTQFEISRKNTWVFNKGRTIYTLTDPFGNYFVMQAYTRTVDPALNPKTLENLDNNPLAAIPTGWTFRTTKLKRPLELKASGSATIIRDGVRSVYQQVK